MEDEGSDRPAKKTSNENNKVKEQINSVDDRDDLTQSSETASEDGELLYYKNSMLLIEQLDTGCKAGTLTVVQARKTVCGPPSTVLPDRVPLLWSERVSDSCEEAKDLLRKNHMLQDEIAMLRLEIDAVKNQYREKEKKYFEDIEIVKGKNDDLQKAIKQNEETLTKTVSQYIKYIQQAKNTMLNSKLENEKESKCRLETSLPF
ncbi:hypothetical protein E5288_WYG022284 [Bos mutus]|uniref:CCDC144C-like coiled-coil domain-containing protein n=1 Tax=Bos mutus TaxID=72004 RepID=A0A6B0RUG2_9CETA|nr:hypothetical protein [Bos mutus]